MNLSRVEYYFADILSATERPDREIVLHSIENGKVPRSLKLPPNLVFVGTVNIDETVQPFSERVRIGLTRLQSPSTSISMPSSWRIQG